jgi:beta-lactamase superfamily II metal-dependent hydrolase
MSNVDGKLLVRAYDVDFGDCIYVRVPDGEDYFHILIDCGSSASGDPKKDPRLKNAVYDVISMLTRQENGKGVLDLLVATHPHADHIKGFDPDWFKLVKIERIWLSAFMNEDHEQAKKMWEFQNLANDASQSLLDRQGLNLAPGVRSLLARSIWNKGALEALRHGFATTSEITGHYPVYIARDLVDQDESLDLDHLKLSAEAGITTFKGFQDENTSLKVLAPEWDIDKFYLGKGLEGGHALFDRHLLEMEAYKGSSGVLDSTLEDVFRDETRSRALKTPENISASEFRTLQNRLLYSALAFSQKDDSLKNNTSAVLLLEWGGRRLLFTGDAEWSGTGVEGERRNSTWDVMLHNQQVKDLLLQPLDYLKVGHHGSHNGTPFHKAGTEDVLHEITDPDRTHVVVSTVAGEHGEVNPVPYPDLLEELGSRSVNRRKYPNDHVEHLQNVFQPQRTDLEPPVAGKTVRYVEVQLEALNNQ